MMNQPTEIEMEMFRIKKSQQRDLKDLRLSKKISMEVERCCSDYLCTPEEDKTLDLRKELKNRSYRILDKLKKLSKMRRSERLADKIELEVTICKLESKIEESFPMLVAKKDYTDVSGRNRITAEKLSKYNNLKQ